MGWEVVYWSFAASPLLVAGLMVALIYALGPRGSCEATLNNNAIYLVWLAGTVVGAAAASAVVYLGVRPIAPTSPMRQALAPVIGILAGIAIFFLGLVPILTYTTCVD